MNRTETRLEGTIAATGEDGRSVTVRVWVTYTIFEPLNGPRQELRGSYLIEFEDGTSAEVIDENTVRSDETGEVFNLIW